MALAFRGDADDGQFSNNRTRYTTHPCSHYACHRAAGAFAYRPSGLVQVSIAWTFGASSPPLPHYTPMPAHPHTHTLPPHTAGWVLSQDVVVQCSLCIQFISQASPCASGIPYLTHFAQHTFLHTYTPHCTHATHFAYTFATPPTRPAPHTHPLPTLPHTPPHLTSWISSVERRKLSNLHLPALQALVSCTATPRTPPAHPGTGRPTMDK